MPRYVLYPGWSQPLADGKCHYVGAEELARLYRVDIHRCAIAPTPGSYEEEWFRAYPDDIPLRVRHDGEYTLPKQ
jgi:hypothetical protein